MAPWTERAAARDVGLGTAYERWAIYRLVRRWGAAAETALEGPIDGIAGMPGLHLLPLARAGCAVTVAHPEAEALARVEAVYRRAGLLGRLRLVEGSAVPAGPFDLVLGFNFLARGWRRHLRRLAAAARRDLLVFVTHPGSWGARVCRLSRRLERRPARRLFDHEACEPPRMRAALREHGTIEEERFVDCPWWPDLFVPAGQTLLSASRARLGAAPGAPRTPHDWGPERFPFASSDRPAVLRRALLRHPTFDGAPAPLASLFAHHRAYRLRRPG